METPRTVVLCGSSLFLAGVEASLANRPGISVVKIGGARAAEWPGLEALRPAAVIIDAGEPDEGRPSAIDQLVSRLPGVLIVSLDLTSSVATLLTSRRRSLASADEVAAAIAEGEATFTGNAAVHT
jgi:DNA-binding NarL/FixJ family response regulator